MKVKSQPQYTFSTRNFELSPRIDSSSNLESIRPNWLKLFSPKPDTFSRLFMAVIWFSPIATLLIFPPLN